MDFKSLVKISFLVILKDNRIFYLSYLFIYSSRYIYWHICGMNENEVWISQSPQTSDMKSSFKVSIIIGIFVFNMFV